MPQELIQEIQECIQLGDEGHIVRASSRLMAALDRHGHLRQAKLLPEDVSVHMLNRDGFGVSAADCHRLIARIAEVGWSDSELSPEDWAKHKEFNAKLAEVSGGMLPPMPERFRYASVAASHTNAALRCLQHEVALHPEVEECKLSMDGRFSVARVQSQDSAMHDALMTGMTWKIISKEAGCIAGVPELLQQAANTGGHLASGKGNSKF